MANQAEKASPPDWRSEYPFAKNYHHLPSGLRMHYVDEGGGPAVVMVHGNPTWSFFYRHTISHLRNHGRRAIAPDHLGCGLSDKPQNYSYRLQDHIDNLTSLLEGLELPSFDLILHDWGGAIGMGYAVQYPNRIRRLVILNSAAFLAPSCPWRIRVCRWPLVGSLLVRGVNGFARAALRMALHHPEILPASSRQGYLAPYSSYARRIAILRFVRDIPLSPEHPSWQTMEAIESNLHKLHDKPMMIAWGMRDFCFTPDFLERWLNFFPDAEVHRFSQAGHYLLEETNQEFNQRLGNFLASPAQSGAH